MNRLVQLQAAMLIAASLAACSPSPKTETATGIPAAGEQAAAEPIKGLPEKDTCDAYRHRKIIGHPYDIPGMPEGDAKLRWIHPDTQVTMDFREDRLNIVVGADGRITELKCG